MSNKMKLRRNSQTGKNQAQVGQKRGRKGINKGILLFSGLIILGLAGFFYLQSGSDQTKGYAKLEGDLKIVKEEVTEDAKFYAFNLDGTNMEVLALRATDGTIRTALNTCQVCYNSGRGYYIQEPNTKDLVCQNCGNRFALDQVEVIKGGCNPIPITPELKTDDGTTITISRDILQEGKTFFTNWSRG